MKKRYSCMILTGLILISCIFIFRYYLHGDFTMVFSDIGSDTREQYLSQINGLSQKLFGGSLSLYDFTNGFGTPTLSYSLTDPFVFLTVFLGGLVGTYKITRLLVYIYILRVVLAGLASYLFLSSYRCSEKSKILAGFLYAFNGYLMVWGQHYSFGTVVILFPLILWCIEKCFLNKKFCFLLTPLAALTFFGSYYFGYMCFLAAGIFTVFRVIQRYHKQEWKKAAAELIVIGCSVLLGIVMAAITMFPSLSYIATNSSRLQEDTSTLQRLWEMLILYPGEYYSTLWNRFLSSNLNGIFSGYTGYNNYYEAPNIGITSFFVLVFPQFLWLTYRTKSEGIKNKILLSVSLFFGGFVLFIQAGSTIFNGMQYPFARQTFVLIPFLVLITAYVCTKISEGKKINYILLGLSVLVTMFLFWKGYTAEITEIYQKNSLFLGICTLFMSLFFLMAGISKRKRVQSVMGLFLMGTVMVYVVKDNYLTYDDRWQLLKSDNEYYEDMYGEDITSALDYLEVTDQSFYRIEKDFDGGSLCMDPMSQGYTGISTYNSIYNKNIDEFVSKLWNNLRIMDQNHLSFRNVVNDTFMSALCNVKYVLSHNPDFKAPGYQMLKQFGTIYIYQNQFADSLGHFFENIIEAKEFESNKTLSKNEILAKAVIVDEKREDAKTLVELGEEKTMPLKGVIDKTATLAQNGVIVKEHKIQFEPSKLSDNTLQVYLNDGITSSDTENLRMEFECKASGLDRIYIDSGGAQLQSFAQGENGITQVSVNLPKDLSVLKLTIHGNQEVVKLSKIQFYKSPIYSLKTQAELEFKLSKKQNQITGKAETERDGIVLLSVPFDEGWKLFIDNKEAEIYRGDYGFIAFDMVKGAHKINLIYEPIGFGVGRAVSIGALVVYLFSIMCYIKKKEILSRFREGKGLKK